MGASVGTDSGKKSVDVELNVVPFIDLMSCLPAFLLVTAVWTNLAQISIKPKGIGRKTEPRLRALGILTIGQLRKCEDEMLRSVLGNRTGHFQRLSRGEDDREAYASGALRLRPISEIIEKSYSPATRTA